jgi:hypothetical protein
MLFPSGGMYSAKCTAKAGWRRRVKGVQIYVEVIAKGRRDADTRK